MRNDAPLPSGFLNILKPPGMSSHTVIARMRRLFGKGKIGHLGTLDPGACGVLPLALGSATRTIAYLPPADKGYLAEITFGYETDTLDDFGNVTTRHNVPTLSEEQLRDICALYRGTIMQVPPSVSALHVEGMRSYELVRQGMAVELPPRPAHYSSVELQELRRYGDTYRAFIAVSCGQGTYIRALVRDIGREIGCGATMSFLLRTRSGLFELSQAITLEELAEGSWATLEAHLLDTGQTLARYGLPTLTVNHGRSAYQRGLVLALGGDAPADLPEKNLLLCDAESHRYFGLGSLLPNRRQVNIERMF